MWFRHPIRDQWRRRLGLRHLIRALGDTRAAERYRAIQELVKVGTPVVPRLTRTLRSWSATRRREAARALGIIGDGRSVDALNRLVRDSDPWVRQTAVAALGSLAAPGSASTLVNVLAEHIGDGRPRESRIAHDAGAALVSIGRAATPSLLKALTAPSEITRRRDAAHLRIHGDPERSQDVFRCMQDRAAVVLGEIGDPAAVDSLIDVLWDQYRHDPHPDADHLPAAKALVKIGTPAVSALIDALDSGAPSLPRTDCACILGQIGDSRAVEPLIRSLRRAYHPDLFARALGRIGDSRAVEPLIDLLGDRAIRFPGNDWKDWQVRMSAAEALVAIGAPRTGEALMDVLGDESQSWNARLCAAHALGRICDRRAVPALLRALESVMLASAEARPRTDDAHAGKEDVRPPWLLDALEQVGKPEELLPLVTILARARPPFPDRLIQAVASTGSLAVDRLLTVLSERTHSDDARHAAMAALGLIRDSRAVDPLIAVLTDKSYGWDTRSVAARALGNIGDMRAAGPLITFASAAKQWSTGYHLNHVWQSSIEALWQLGGPDAEAWFRSGMEGQDPRPRRDICRVIGKAGGERAAAFLTEVLRHEADPEVLGPAATFLGKIGGGQALDALIDAHQKSTPVSAVVDALAQIGDPRGARPAVSALPDIDLVLLGADQVGRTLAHFGEAAVDPLLAALRDKSEQVRVAAATALGEIAAPQALETMIAGLEDPSPKVRMLAAKALGRIGDPAALDALWATLARPADPFWGQDEIIVAILDLEERMYGKLSHVQAL